MSVQDPVEIVKEAWQRFASGGVPAAQSLLAEDVEWTSRAGSDRLCKGRHALLQHFRQMAVSGTRLEAVGHRFEDHGDCVVVVGRVRLLGPEGLYDIPMSWQVVVRDGLIVCVRARRRVEDARADCADATAA